MQRTGELLTVSDGSAVYKQGWCGGLRVIDPLPLAAWSDEYRMLPKVAAAEPGKWRTERTPYLREIMACLDPDHPCQEVVFMKGAQVGGTEVLLNWAFWHIHQDPGPMMVVEPTVDMAEKWSKQRFAPALGMMPALKELLSGKSRDGGNTIFLKEFPGGIIIISGANSASSLRSMPIKRLGLDEVDAYPLDLDGEGSPVDLATQRTSTFVRRKILKISTPTVKDLSVIEREFALSDQRYYHVPCPKCDYGQVLQDDHITDDGFYLCEHCGHLIADHHKTRMFEQGIWIPSATSKIPGFHLSAHYAPYGLGWTWADVADKRKKAKAKPENWKTYVNTVMGKTYEEAGTNIQIEHVKGLVGAAISRDIPDGCLILTLGVDVQHDRLALHLVGWGRGECCWIIDYIEIPGSPAKPKVWEDLTQYRRTRITNRYGVDMPITATAIDTGGEFTHEVYNYCRNHDHELVMAIKGAKEVGKPVIATRPSLRDVRTDGGMLKEGVKLWMLGVNTAKGVLYTRLRADIESAGERMMHFPSDLPDSYFEMLVAESYDRRSGRFVNLHRRRNEALDTWGYAYAAALHPLVRIHMLREADWNNIAAKLQPVREPEGDTPAPASPPPNKNTALRRHKPGYVKRY